MNALYPTALLLIGMPLAGGCAQNDNSPPTGPTPGAGTGQTCRTYVGEVTTYLEAGGELVSTTTAMCSYDAGANEMRCTGDYTDATGCVAPVTATTRYASLADFVDEVAVVPPTTRWTERTGTIGGSCTGQPPIFGFASFTSGSVTVLYDGQGRVTRTVSSDGETTYTAWDSSGRPTAGPAVQISYDDAARTVIVSPGMGTLTSIALTFDVFGNLVVRQDTPASGPVATASSYIDSAVRVCRP